MITSQSEMAQVVRGTHPLLVASVLGEADRTAFIKNPLAFLDALMATPEGEARLVQTMASLGREDCPSWWKELTDFWVGQVLSGLSGPDHSGGKCVQSPILKVIEGLTKGIMVPRPDNFTPATRTPWGGEEIRSLLRGQGVGTGDIVGEAWVISGHPSFPNKFVIKYAGRLVEVPLWLVGRLYPKEFYGPANVQKFGNEPPFLIKLLNSGGWEIFKNQLEGMLEKDAGILKLNHDELHRELRRFTERLMGTEPQKARQIAPLHQAMLEKNLSVQIHPTAEYCSQHPEKNWHSKTEAWVILDAEEGAGLYLGLKEGVNEEQIKTAVEAGQDITSFLNFVTVKPGDVFYIPAGTIHAVGAGVMLLEVQETSETTFRFYDYGRFDDQGRPRCLHLPEALAVTNWKDARGLDFINKVLRREPRPICDVTGGTTTACLQNIIQEREFLLDRVVFNAGDIFSAEVAQGMHGINIISGEVCVCDPPGNTIEVFSAGQALIIPSAFVRYTLKANQPATIFVTHTVPFF